MGGEVCYRFLAGRNQILTEALRGGARVLEEMPTPCGPVATTEHAVVTIIGFPAT